MCSLPVKLLSLHNLFSFFRCWLIAGVDPNDPDYAGTRPLHVAARALVHPDIVHLLLNYGAKSYYSDGNGKTPIDILNAVAVRKQLTFVY